MKLEANKCYWLMKPPKNDYESEVEVYLRTFDQEPEDDFGNYEERPSFSVDMISERLDVPFRTCLFDNWLDDGLSDNYKEISLDEYKKYVIKRKLKR